MKKPCPECNGMMQTVSAAGGYTMCPSCNGVGVVSQPNVVELDLLTDGDLDPDRMLLAQVGHLEDVVIIGYTHEGKRMFSSSMGDGGKVLWLMQQSMKTLLETDGTEDE